MRTVAIARLICELIESRKWISWKGKGIRECTDLTKGQVTIGIIYLASKGYVKKDEPRGRGWWTKTRKFDFYWKIFLGRPKTKFDMKTRKLKYA